MEKYALIVAGGAGLRMGNPIPKQFILLHGKPVLWYTIQAFQQAYQDINIIIIAPQSELNNEFLQSVISDNIKVVVGGETRFHSVQNGLAHVPDNTVVFVHDGVRCLVTPQLIHRCFEQAVEKGSAIPVVPATDSLRIEKDASHEVIDRQYIRIVQTPQTFISTALKQAFELPYQQSFTDEATVMESFGKEVFLINGDYENIKITRPVDLLIAEKILTARSLL